jgi:HKD family nuclease
MQNELKQTEEIAIDVSSINYKTVETPDFLVNNKLIVNSEKGNLLNELKACLNECESFYFSVAFINFSGLQLLLDSFKGLEEKGVKGKIVTSTYLNFTEPKALERINKFNNIDLKIFVATKELGFHTKAYVFQMKDEYKIIIGSSNITQRALKSNIEWNVKVISKKDNSFAKEVLEEYINLWETTTEVDKNFLDSYSDFIKELRNIEKSKSIDFKDYEIIKPNSMQKRAIENLNRLRFSGEDKALVISATGTGKTYMSAFDVVNYEPKKMLFLVHREEILRSAEKTFKKLVKNKDKSMGLLTGTRKDTEVDYLFSTIQSMNICMEQFKKDEFEYIVMWKRPLIMQRNYLELILMHWDTLLMRMMTMQSYFQYLKI